MLGLLRSFKGGAFPGLLKTKHKESTQHGVCVFRVPEGCRLHTLTLCVVSKSPGCLMSQSPHLFDPLFLNIVRWASYVKWYTTGKDPDNNKINTSRLIRWQRLWKSLRLLHNPKKQQKPQQGEERSHYQVLDSVCTSNHISLVPLTSSSLLVYRCCIWVTQNLVQLCSMHAEATTASRKPCPDLMCHRRPGTQPAATSEKKPIENSHASVKPVQTAEEWSFCSGCGRTWQHHWGQLKWFPGQCRKCKGQLFPHGT